MWCVSPYLVYCRSPNMREDGAKEELLLRRLYERSAEICVLRQRIEVLLQVPLSDTPRYSDVDHGTRPPGSTCSPKDVPDSASDTAQCRLDVSDSQEIGNRETLMGCVARARESTERQAEMELSRAIPASSTTFGPGQHTEALRALLCTPSVTSIPSLRGVASGDPQSRTRESSASAPPTLTTPGDLREDTTAGDGSAITYRMFLTRLMRPESKGFVRAIRMFLFSIIGNGGDVSSISAGPIAAAGGAIPPDLEDVEIYGSSFLVQRCAEFFLAMQNAMGVHPSWAELGYDSIVTCREHLERFVMTKIHPLALGRKLNGAVDGSISARLRALQFLTPDHLGVVAHARDDKVLGLAQDELRKMDSGRCPGDMLSRVVRCCDIIFALLDQGRRDRPKMGGRIGPGWRPDLDPASTADDFLPVLILVVLRANVPRLHSMSEYVQAFHSPVALMSRPGYCFVALRSSVEFLMTLTGAEVGMSKHEFRRRALETIRGASGAPAAAITPRNG